MTMQKKSHSASAVLDNEFESMEATADKAAGPSISPVSLGFPFAGVRLRKVPAEALKHRADVFDSGFDFKAPKVDSGPLEFHLFMPREAQHQENGVNEWPLVIYLHGSNLRGMPLSSIVTQRKGSLPQ